MANNQGGGWEIYRASKAALNQLMRSYAARHHDDKRTLLLLAPGWVKTDMGGSDARLTIEESIPRLVATVDAQRDRPGLQYLDYQGQTVPWRTVLLQAEYELGVALSPAAARSNSRTEASGPATLRQRCGE